ncbi:MAG: YqeG family HAD IIIA-type phosphatase [Firmicutes bacterium]|jgi:HAD superfamily phosphatase (TIGR01668 family)|nr:YqeG family HAD IIIA-type phosphatase [Bacillota bacterium]NLO65504.1 YqeG family HAD IIIA-type phosphatase [Bacillota bacterium]
MGLLQPDFIVESVLDIDLGALREKGIAGLLVDIDNTLVAWADSSIDEAFAAWIRRAKEEGLRVCIVSNALEERTTTLARSLGIPAVGRAMKPLKRAFLRGLALLELPAEEVAVVGDQLFTDIFGGNRLGMLTVLVNPLSRQEFATTKLVRKIEERVLRRMVKRGRLSSDAIETRLGRK